MSDTVNVEEVLAQDFPYAEEKDLPAKEKFATTRKAGYVEEEVDQWVNRTIENVTEFLNRYNSAAYALSLAKVEINKTKTELATIKNDVQRQVDEAVAQRHAQMEAEFNSHYDALKESATQNQNVLAAEIESLQAQLLASQSHVAELQTSLEQAHEALVQGTHTVAVPPAEEVAPVAVPVPVVENVVAPVTPTVDATVASQRAREIMEAAAQEASEHVSRALQKVAFVEGEAQAEADAILNEALAEAERIKLQAFEDANEAIEIKNKAVAERNEIFERLRMFYVAQEQSIEEEMKAIDYTPYLNLNDSPASQATTTGTEPTAYAPTETTVTSHPVSEPAVAHTEDAMKEAGEEPKAATPSSFSVEDAFNSLDKDEN